MKAVQMDGVYGPSEDIVAREIVGELIIVPLTAGFGDMEDELYTLNEAGKAIWRLLDGERSLAAIANELANDFDTSLKDIEADVLGLATELVKRGMLVEILND